MGPFCSTDCRIVITLSHNLGYSRDLRRISRTHLGTADPHLFNIYKETIPRYYRSFLTRAEQPTIHFLIDRLRLFLQRQRHRHLNSLQFLLPIPEFDRIFASSVTLHLHKNYIPPTTRKHAHEIQVVNSTP